MSETTARPCYRETNGVHFTKSAHRPDCTEVDCRGCQPCPEPRHCTARRNCTWHIAEGELTCGRCLASARTDLRWIATLAPLLPVAAEGDGIDSEAANLAGPATDSEAWSWRRIATATATGELIGDGEDEHHPLTVLGTWEFMIREDYDHHTGRPATVAGTAGYLDRMLHRIAHDDRQDFPLLARELRKCRQHLEATLRNDDRPERGAPCPECTGPDTGLGPRLIRKRGHWCDDEACERMHFSVMRDADTGEVVPDTTGDTWTCPRNRDHEWTHKAYSQYVEQRRQRRVSA